MGCKGGWIQGARRVAKRGKKLLKNDTHISGRPGWNPNALPQALLFFRKMIPIFLEALDSPLRCRRCFFFLGKMTPIFLEALDSPLAMPQALFFLRKMTPIFLDALALFFSLFFFQKNDPHIFGGPTIEHLQ